MSKRVTLSPASRNFPFPPFLRGGNTTRLRLACAFPRIRKHPVLFTFVFTLCLVLSHAQAEDKKPAADKPSDTKAAVEKDKNAVATAKADAAKADTGKKLDPKIIQRKLRARTDLKVEKLSLEEVVKKLSEFHEVPIRLDKEALKKANVAIDAPVTVTIENYTLSAALKHILKDFGLHFGVVEGAVVITNTLPEPEPAAAAPVAEIAVPMMVGLGGPNAQQLEMTPQYQAMLRAELNFAKQTCQATPDQMQKLRDELNKNLKEQPPAQAGVGVRNLGQKQVRVVQQGAVGDPLQLARDRLAKAVKTCLSAEQAARFQEELDKRTLDRRRSAAHVLVARLDREMILSAKQREELSESLLAHWNDAWGSSMQMFIYNDQFFPNIPDAHVVKFLNDTQKKIWPTIPKNQGAMMVNGFMGGMFGDAVMWDEDNADAPAKKPDEQER